MSSTSTSSSSSTAAKASPSLSPPIRRKRGKPLRGTWSAFIAARQARGMTQTEAARFFGCSQSTVSEWEGLRTSPGLGDIPRLSEFLGMTRAETAAHLAEIFLPGRI